MALTSTLGSPGIEVREIDNSIRIDSSTTTTVFVPGFASQGPVEEVMSIGSMDDFELIYGKPTNGAERYFYYTVKALIDKGGSGCRVLTSRLPYGEGLGDAVSDAYTLLAYPAVPIIPSSNNVETDCFKLSKTDDENFISIVIYNEEEQDEVVADTEHSTVEIFIEEDFLNDVEFDFNDSITIAFADETNEPFLPDISSSDDVDAHTLEWWLKENDENGTPSSKGKVSTEFINGYLYVNLSYSLYFKKNLDKEEVKVGSILMRLAFKATPTNKLTPLTVNKYKFKAWQDDQVSYKQAFEIAKSYDGQSAEQLGNWDIYEQYNETNHKDNKDGNGKILTEDTNKFSKDVTYLVGAPATFQVSLKEYYDIITGEYINWSRRPYNFSDDEFSVQNVRVYETSNDKVGSESRFGLLEAIGHSAFITINTSRTCIN